MILLLGEFPRVVSAVQFLERRKLIIERSGWKQDRHGLIRTRGGLTN